MTGVVASAPGKIVLSGEYAVLDGAPAVCMAVDRRARVRVGSSDAAWNRVIAPGYTSIEGRFVSRGKSPEWLQGETEFGLVDAAWRQLSPPEKSGRLIELDTRAFFETATARKLGLGSSAALTVALVAALAESDDILSSAMAVHRAFQHGTGSGVDIAAAVNGGIIEYRMRPVTIKPLCWPEGLDYRLIWTGVPASTGTRLERFREAGSRPSRRALVQASTDMAASWRSASAVMDCLPSYIGALRHFSEDYDLGIFGAGHDKLTADADAAGLIYKPCGAGGGDVGILLGTNKAQLDEFLDKLETRRLLPLDCRLDANGVTWRRT